MNFRYRLIFLFMFLALYSYSFSQPTIEWQKCLGGGGYEEVKTIQQTRDGGYIVGGSSYSNDRYVSGHHGTHEYSDYWIVKLNSFGNIQWQKSLGGSLFDNISSIQQTNDGGYIIAGSSFSNDGDVIENHGNYDCWVVKLDSNGLMQWQKSLGGSDEDYAHSIQQTIDGGYILAGWTKSGDGDVKFYYNNYWIVKLDSNGLIQWQNAINKDDQDYNISIRQTRDSGYIVLANSYPCTIGNHGGEDYLVVKLDSTGEIQWQKYLGGSRWEYANSIEQTSDGGYIIAGYTNSDDGDVTGHKGDSSTSDYWIVKLDSKGDIQLQKSIGGSEEDLAYSIKQTYDGGYIVAGTTCSSDGDISGYHDWWDFWIVKLDSIGVIKWQKSLGGSNCDIARSIQQTNDRGYIIAGYSYSKDGDVSGNHGGYDFWIVKLSPDITDVKDNTKPNNPELSISPNPASDNISISFPGGINQSIHIYNSLGIEIKRFEEKDLFEKNSIEVNVEVFPSGVYYVVQYIGCLPDIQCLTKSFVVIR